MEEYILVGVAWPYANGPLHMGHIAGAYLPADIFARYQRMKGNHVLMVSGSDQHGTPITIAAAQQNKNPQEIAARYHSSFLECWRKLGISFDLFTTTGTANHEKVTHDIFLSLLQKGYIYKSRTPQAYCQRCNRFLPDRYVTGLCPHCSNLKARGDQCDECGKPLNPADLLNLQCGICGGTPDFKESEHFFLRLSEFGKELLSWVKQQSHWRQNVRNSTISFIESGLKDRAITRDIDWGITVPHEGFDNKRIYVWFEAVIGYLSASIEWANLQENSSDWQSYWTKNAKAYYFIGKDNIPFHTIIWPAMLIGYGKLNLPYDVPANEFLTIEGKRLSTSRNWAVWVPEYLSRYDPDPLRYYLSINMPEIGDSNFSWEEYVNRNNGELVGTYGNLVHRVLTFIQRNLDGRMPCLMKPDSRSTGILNKVNETMKSVSDSLAECRFREALRNIFSLAQEANRYLDEMSPWKRWKEDRDTAETSLYVIVTVISGLCTMLYPFLPFSSQKLHDFLGLPGEMIKNGWSLQIPSKDQLMPAPEPLFSKLDENIINDELGRLGQPYIR